NPPKKEDSVDVWRIFDFSNVDPDAKKRIIHTRQNLTRDLWDYRELMVNPCVDSTNCKISFHQAVSDNKRERIKAETNDNCTFPTYLTSEA
ncbi:MAG: hypothetical protein IKX88_15785, partial [Thermoguttaceae bacterium]|nr:hypothetical protein [Thermoguttaceae bacterium]